MKRTFRTACLAVEAFAIVLGAAHLPAAAGTNKAEVVDGVRLLDAACESAVHVPSLFLSQQEKIKTVETFVKMVGIKSQSRYEGAVRDMLRQRLALLNPHEIVCDRHEANGPLNLETPDPPLTNAPLNLIMEIPATKDFEDRPAVILNAHMDTIEVGTRCVPEEMDFAVSAREFFHRRNLSFGADDKAGVTTILRALETVKAQYWDKGVGHRKFIVLFTAQEDYGYVGSRYLAEYYPELFDNIEIELTTDGPLDYDTPALYPKDSFIVVVDEETSYAPPYRQIIESVQDVCYLKHASFAKTTTGLGHGDFAFFPAKAHTDLHIRSPYKGNHKQERVKLDDLFNHIDLFTDIILHLDGTPVHIPAP
jgi:putative aminopeptidase FrvX